MAVNVSLQVEGQNVLDFQFRAAAKSIEDLSGAFEAAHKVFLNAEADNFQSENATGKSGKWKPLSAAYEKRKVAKYGTFALLAGIEVASEALYKSLTRKTGDSVKEIEPLNAKFGTTLPYAKAQHFGVSSKNLPARPLIDLSDEQLKEMKKEMRKEIVGEIKRRTTLIVDETNYTEI